MIRQLVLEIQNEVYKSQDLLPERASELLVQLSALLGNIGDEIRTRQLAFNQVLLTNLESEKKATHAKIKSEISPEYQVLREAMDTQKLSIEIIRSLKFFLRSKEEEFRQSKNI